MLSSESAFSPSYFYDNIYEIYTAYMPSGSRVGNFLLDFIFRDDLYWELPYCWINWIPNWINFNEICSLNGKSSSLSELNLEFNLASISFLKLKWCPFDLSVLQAITLVFFELSILMTLKLISNCTFLN